MYNAKQHANAQIETVHYDVHQRGKDNDNKPDYGDIDVHQIFSSSSVTGSAAESGRAGVPSVCEVSSLTG